jgi:GNAT superfamily N-acetyltransferase
VFVTAIADLPMRPPPMPGLIARRTLGVNGTRIWALVEDEVVGFIEVDTNLGEGNRAAGISAWADVGNLQVGEPYRRVGIGSWLVAQAADWLRLAGVERLIDYADAEDRQAISFLLSNGFRELTRTIRGLVIP